MRYATLKSIKKHGLTVLFSYAKGIPTRNALFLWVNYGFELVLLER